MLLIVLLSGLLTGWLAVETSVLTKPGMQTTPVYACVRGPQVIWWGIDEPDRCPRNSRLIYDPAVQYSDPQRSIGHRLTAFVRDWLSIPGVMAALLLGSCAWMATGWKVTGSLRLSWLVVPVMLLVAAACVAGPGHWFPKEPYEGPSVIPLGSRDAVTALDLAGFALAGLALLLALFLTTRHRSLTPDT